MVDQRLREAWDEVAWFSRGPRRREEGLFGVPPREILV